MSEINIRPVENTEQLRIFKRMTKYAFSSSPNRSATDDPKDIDDDEIGRVDMYLLYDGETPVSSLNAIPMTQNVRGKLFEMQGIAGVSTYPEHRRKGYVSKLMDLALRKAKDNNQVLSTLYPFRQSFYGKYGYITFPQARVSSFKPSNLRDIKNYNFSGKVERYLIGEKIDRYFTFLKNFQKKRHGIGIFQRDNYDRYSDNKTWIVFASVDGKDQGIMLFSTTGFEKEFKIKEFLYLNSNAKYVLLDHIARHADQFSEVKMRVLEDEQPELWMYDTKMDISSRNWVPSAMGRIVDIRGLIGMKVGTGRLTIKITDDACPWNESTWLVSSENGRLNIQENLTGDQELSMNIEALSAIIYGVYNPDDLVAKGWMNTVDHNGSLEKLFPTLRPSLLSNF